MYRKFKMLLTGWGGGHEIIVWRWGIYACISVGMAKARELRIGDGQKNVSAGIVREN
jgi:hypothetical protein